MSVPDLNLGRRDDLGRVPVQVLNLDLLQDVVRHVSGPRLIGLIRKESVLFYGRLAEALGVELDPTVMEIAASNLDQVTTATALRSLIDCYRSQIELMKSFLIEYDQFKHYVH